jgi:hypothetical protein
VITLLQSLYMGDRLLPGSREYYERVLREIHLSYIGPQVYYMLRERKLLDETPDFFRASLKQEFDKTGIQNLLLKQSGEKLLQAYEAAEIPVIPLKGTWFTEKYFGHLAARGSSDIDLFVQTADLKRAIACAQTLQYRLDEQVHNHAVLVKPTSLSTDMLAVELHWSMDKKNWSDVDDTLFWEGAYTRQGARYIRELSDLHAFYFMCMHGIRHRMDAVKFLLDIAQMLVSAGERIDLYQLLEIAERDKTRKRIMIALSIVYSQFPHLQELKPLPFEPLETGWNYRSMLKKQMGIKDMDYYRYVSYFKFQIFDTWKHTLLSQNQIYYRNGKYQSMED